MAKGKPNRLARVLGATLGVLVLLAAIVAGGLALCYQVLFPKPYHPIVSKYAQEFGVDENLIYSVMKCESSFDPSATSSVPAMGLMQITEDTFDWISSKLPDGENYTVDQLYEPEVAIYYGTFFLSYLLEEFGHTQVALSAYHAGRGITNQWLEDPQYSGDGETLDVIPYPDTSQYVESVLGTYRVYQRLY